jgi:hypothetical protein
MSSALAIAAVTAILKDLLDNRLVQKNVIGDVGDVTVTALPPDRVTIGSDERAQLNLFMYRVTPHVGWRRSRVTPDPQEQHAAPPLMLDLHYLLSAYGEQDLQAEMLLGHAIQLFQETPVLTGDAIRSALKPTSSNGARHATSPAHAALASSGLAEEVDRLTICPEFLGMEETTRLWSALQAHYRPSAVYEVSAIFIRDDR